MSFEAQGWTCTHCNNVPALVDGFPAFAPAVASVNDGFEERFFAELVELEAQNFWFKARSALVRSALNKHFPAMRSFLEIGCGTGYMLSEVERVFPRVEASGSEIFTKGLELTGRRVQRAKLFQMDARHIPFEDEFDVIGAFDVIEHITEDEAVLYEMHRAVRRGGGIVITVPQHQFLWSYVDEYSHHKRRYSRNELRTKVEKAGFKVTRMTSFVSLLLPLMLLSRLRNKHARPDYEATAELRLNRFLNLALTGLMSLERLIIASGVSLPAGGSLMLVARKS